MTPVTSAHEVGHSLGFRHSSTSGSTYGDNSVKQSQNFFERNGFEGLQGNRGVLICEKLKNQVYF